MSAKQPTPPGEHVKLIAQNRRARFDYVIEEKLEAGLALMGSEVKSLRAGNANLADSYAIPRGVELFLVNCRIGTYAAAGAYGHADPTRARKLLLHRKELDQVIAKVSAKGYTLVPLSLYFKSGRAKVELGLCRGKTHGDRREDIKSRESEREIARALRPGRRDRHED